MDIPLDDLARARGGFLLTRHLLRLGIGQNMIRALVRDGTLVRPRHGTYVPAQIWADHDAVGRYAIVTRSVLARAGEGAVASHQSAAALHGLDLWQVDLRRVHLTRVDGRTGRREAGVVWHEPAAGDDPHGEVVDGVRCVSSLQAGLETAALHELEAGVVVLSSAMRRAGTSEPELQDHVGRFWSRTGAEHVRLAATLADGRLESVGEARSVVMFWRHDVPMPTPQVTVVDSSGRVLARVDFDWELFRHLGEFDGLIKYGRLNPDLADPGRTVVEEKQREDRLRGTRRGMSRWVWTDLAPHVQATTAARIAHALDQSRRLYVPVGRTLV